MNNMETVLNMIATDALEEGSRDENGEYVPPIRFLEDKRDLPTIDYRLELIQNEDGSYEWVE